MKARYETFNEATTILLVVEFEVPPPGAEQVRIIPLMGPTYILYHLDDGPPAPSGLQVLTIGFRELPPAA